ncbi:MAG TPA: glycosyltransferase [Candidatus Atribacteria bacterium]|nr:glycosyltransferase [Candidatus Atribacteria bacterium]
MKKRLRVNKVCILTTVHNTFDTRIFYKQANTLAKAGYNVTLISQYRKNEVVEGIRIIALPILYNRLIRILVLPWYAFKLALYEKAAIYHFHDPELIPVAILLSLLGKRVIYDVHEDFPRQILSKYWIPAKIRRIIAKIAELIEKIACRFYTKIVAATPAIAHRFPHSKTVIVQNFPILNEITIEDTIPYLERPPYIIYVGQITEIRGAQEMIQAMSYLPENLGIKLLLIGNFVPSALETKLRQLPGWKYVEFLGWKTRDELRQLLGKSRVGLVLFHPKPNHIEAQPNKLFEYMSAGLPVVASNFPLWQQIIEKTGSGLTVDPLNPEKIAEAIEYLITHPKEAQQMGQNGRILVLKKYNWAKEAEKLLTMYREILS